MYSFRLVRYTASGAPERNTFFENLFTESTDIHCRYEVPREEPREAHGYFGSNLCQLMFALSVNYIVGKCKGQLHPT
jgi:hypothetical protein